jgi:toxin-antitoxin system PIN domain toxin
MPKSKICLPDINVWIACAWQGHIHHETVKPWFAALEPGQAAFCRVTQMGFLRLITNEHVMGPDVLSQRNAWRIYDDLARDKRVTFAIEPAEIEPVWKSFTQGRFTGTNVWTDAYLGALASVQGMRLVSLDRGLVQIKQLEALIPGRR